MKKGYQCQDQMREKMEFFMRVRRANRFPEISVYVFPGHLLSEQRMAIMNDAG